METILSETATEFRDELRAWFTANLPEGWLDGACADLDDPTGLTSFRRSWQKRIYDAGLAAIAWPKEYGGRDADLTMQIVFEEERRRFRAPGELNVFGTRMAGPMLIEHGNEQQRARYLRPLLSGEHIWAEGFSEPGAGSDLAGLRTSAREQSDGSFRVNGQKIWTSRAGDADYILLLARTNRDAPKHRGLSAFIVDAKSPGITMRPIRQITGEEDFYEVFYDDVVVPAENMVGERDHGWDIAVKTLLHERLAVSWIFELENLLEVIQEQLTQNPHLRRHTDYKIVDLYSRIYATKLFYLRSVDQQARGGEPSNGGALVKLLTSELAKELARFGMSRNILDELDTDIGRSRPNIPNSWTFEYLDAFRQTIAGGTSEIMRNIVGERSLGLPRS